MAIHPGSLSRDACVVESDGRYELIVQGKFAAASIGPTCESPAS